MTNGYTCRCAHAVGARKESLRDNCAKHFGHLQA